MCYCYFYMATWYGSLDKQLDMMSGMTASYDVLT